MTTKFEITDEDQNKINEWLIKLHPRIMELSKKFYVDTNRLTPEEFSTLTNNNKIPYYGAIGGGLTYSFLPSYVDISISVREILTGEVLHL